MRRSRPILLLAVVALLASLGAAPAIAAPATPVTFTILHTNDFHGQLEPAGSNPGMARAAAVVNGVRTAVGAANVLLVDAGDEMQGSLLSNLQQGEPTIATYNAMGYAAATFGNHEFDWGQTVLTERTDQAAYPYVTANIVQNDTGNCATAGWTPPTFADAPYQLVDVGAPVSVKVGIIGVTTAETPTITIASATEGLCFKDPAESIIHYYDAVKAAGADVIVVLSHLGYPDGGYGYGIPVYGDQTLASKLNAAGKPANLIIGGHSHTNLSAATMVGSTAVVQAYYSGRRVGRADVTVDTSGAVDVSWQSLTVSTTGPEDAPIKALIDTYATDPDYLDLINTEIGWTNVPITRDYNGDSLMGAFVDDAIYNDLNTDADLSNDVDMVFNNPGGLRTDITCAAYPCLINYGMAFNVLPFGNQTVVGDMTGAQITELLNQSATLFKGALQVAGTRYGFFRYSDTLPGPQPYAWGAYDVTVYDKTSSTWKPLDLKKTYRVATNEFLAPAGQDGFVPFKYMTNISYWGDMLDGVNRWVNATYTEAAPYDGALDGRITRDGTDAGGSIVPVTILHHNDSHGNLAKGTYVGYTQLATLIKEERAHNPDRTLLLNGGDSIQGDAMSYYFKSAPTGFTADGTAIADPGLHMQPFIKATNAMDYDAMTLGNHEFNFGSDIFKAVMGQADYPVLGANVTDTGAYGLASANGGAGVQPYVEKTVGTEGIKVAILGITNHRVPNYELPSNIPGLTFSDPIAKAQELSTALRGTNDAIVALTHIGFTENPSSVEVDANVDTNMAMTVTGLDAIVGSHSHTNPATGFGAYKYLPTIVADPDDSPVVISQAYRYNNTLGEIVLGMRAKAGGGYEPVSRTGRYISVPSDTTEDAAIKAIVDPYTALLSAYNNTVIGETTVPIDALEAFTQETNGANLQADASVYELETKNGIPVDFHLSGAMTNRKVADAATPESPVTLKVADMFSLMPYENSLVVMEMNGPQLKAVLERAYRNYYYYEYVPGYGGYSYYTTCMLDTDFGNQIQYRDMSPDLPDGNNVVSLLIGGEPVDFSDAGTYYRVSTVNYLAAGSCNFNDAGVSLWPLDQIVNDTQYYVRDAVIDYITAKGTVSPAIEGRLLFGDTTAPEVGITSPVDGVAYLHSGTLPLTYTATDDTSGVASVVAELDGTATAATAVDLGTLALGSHTFSVTATDYYGNSASASVTFTVEATTASLKTLVSDFYASGDISKAGVMKGLTAKLDAAEMSVAKGNSKAAANQLEAFISEVKAQSGKSITPQAAAILIADAKYLIANL